MPRSLTLSPVSPDHPHLAQGFRDMSSPPCPLLPKASTEPQEQHDPPTHPQSSHTAFSHTASLAPFRGHLPRAHTPSPTPPPLSLPPKPPRPLLTPSLQVHLCPPPVQHSHRTRGLPTRSPPQRVRRWQRPRVPAPHSSVLLRPHRPLGGAHPTPQYRDPSDPAPRFSAPHGPLPAAPSRPLPQHDHHHSQQPPRRVYWPPPSSNRPMGRAKRQLLPRYWLRG